VIEVKGRYLADGTELEPLDQAGTRGRLEAAYRDGYRSVAIVFMHSYRFHEHEKRIAALAREIGFTQVSASHEVSPLMKIVSRGDTAVVDAYLSPILRRYVDRVAGALGGARLMFMQSNGGLVDRRPRRCGLLPGQGFDSLRTGRRRGGRCQGERSRRPRQGDRLRHGRHLDRRLALCRRL
jgi:N-methylhydantoinase A/oxoprolinase/acetone carboxylase beta subunit